MADKTHKQPSNIEGKYYVDAQCIDCDLCRQTAPNNFERSDAGGYSYVYRQPANEQEAGLCEQAKEECPVEAIGNDA